MQLVSAEFAAELRTQVDPDSQYAQVWKWIEFFITNPNIDHYVGVSEHHIDALNKIGLNWLYLAEHDLDNCRFARRTGEQCTHLESAQDRYAIDEAEQLLTKWIHGECEQFLNGLPEPIRTHA